MSAEVDICDDLLHVREGKAMMSSFGEKLKVSLTEILQYKRQFSVRTLTLLVSEFGQSMNAFYRLTRLDTARQATDNRHFKGRS